MERCKSKSIVKYVTISVGLEDSVVSALAQRQHRIENSCHLAGKVGQENRSGSQIYYLEERGNFQRSSQDKLRRPHSCANRD